MPLIFRAKILPYNEQEWNAQKGEEVNRMKTMKGFLLGIILTIVVEAGIFMYQTCNVQVTTKYIYNPSNIVNMIPEGSEVVTTK